MKFFFSWLKLAWHRFKVGEEKEVSRLGMEDSPVLIYYEEGIPNLYPGSLADEEAVLAWLVAQRNTASIEDVTDSLLRSVVEDNEYVAVYFRQVNGRECLALSMLLGGMESEICT